MYSQDRYMKNLPSFLHCFWPTGWLSPAVKPLNDIRFDNQLWTISSVHALLISTYIYRDHGKSSWELNLRTFADPKLRNVPERERVRARKKQPWHPKGQGEKSSWVKNRYKSMATKKNWKAGIRMWQRKTKEKERCLMEATHLGQRAWVENDLPRVSEVLEKFPPLKQPKHVSHSFYGITFYLWCRWLMINNFTKRLQHCLKNFSHTPYSFSLRYFLDDCISSSIASPVLTS